MYVHFSLQNEFLPRKADIRIIRYVYLCFKEFRYLLRLLCNLLKTHFLKSIMWCRDKMIKSCKSPLLILNWNFFHWKGHEVKNHFEEVFHIIVATLSQLHKKYVSCFYDNSFRFFTPHSLSFIPYKRRTIKK